MRKYNGINRRGFLRSAMLSGAAMCVSSISNEMVANESRDKQEPLALGSKVAAGITQNEPWEGVRLPWSYRLLASVVWD